jgi:hypothetical protein
MTHRADAGTTRAAALGADASALRERARAGDPGGREPGRRDGYRFGLVLLLLAVTYVVGVAAPSAAWARLVSIILEGATLLVAMAASQVSVVITRVTGAIIGVIVLAAVVVLPEGSGGNELKGAFFVVGLLLVVVAPVVIVRGLVVRPVIDARTVLGALCVYVLLGMAFAFTYGAVDAFSSGPFFAQHVHATISDFLYFSFVTLTTVGYGDLSAAGGLGRGLAVLEALLGQIYLVTVVAVLVGTLSRRSRDGGGLSTLGVDAVETGTGGVG